MQHIRIGKTLLIKSENSDAIKKKDRNNDHITILKSNMPNTTITKSMYK